MNDFSEKLISMEEARAALKAMRLGGLNEDEALECIDEVAERVRKVTCVTLVEDIIESKLSAVQRDYIKKFWYEQKNTAQIAREYGVTQAGVYRTIERANEIIKDLMSSVLSYQNNLKLSEVKPLAIEGIMEVSSASKSFTASFCEALRNQRVSRAIAPETLARALKISRKELEDIENGYQIPSAVTVMRYTALFEMEIKMTFINGRGSYEWQKA